MSAPSTSDKRPSDSLSRRGLLGGISALGITAAASPVFAVGADGPAMLPDPSDRAANLRQLMRLQMGIEPGDALWWYTGRIYAQIQDQEPQHLFNLEGTEIYWPRPVGDGTYKISSRTLTFMRDKDSGKMLRTYKNPITDKTVEVTPNRLGGRDGATYSKDGLNLGHGFGEEGVTVPWRIEWHSSGDTVWLTSSRGVDFLPQPWLEAMTISCPRSQFADSEVTSTDSFFTSTYLSPWLSWMGMGERAGHLVWHSSGRKLASIDEVPAEYRQRVDKEYGGVLTANPASFAD